MIWFAWRVQRPHLLVAGAAVGGLAIWFTLQGLHEQSFWNCLLERTRPAGKYSYCSAASSSYNIDHWNPYSYWVLYAVPALIGVLLGAQLVARDLEHKTARIAWTQSVTRTRWLVTKLLFVGVIVAALVAGTVALAEWWTGAVRAGATVLPGPFDVTGTAPVSYGLFAFLLGAALGAVMRRTGWAVFFAISLFGLTRALLRFDVRPHLASTAVTAYRAMPDFSYPFSPLGFPKGWILNAGYLPLGRSAPPTGNTWVSWQYLANTCYLRSFIPVTPNSRMGIPALDQLCLAAHRLHYVIQYQPQGNYWQLQVEESAIFLLAGIALALVTLIAVRKRSA